ncbi:peptidylprolyl isomerase [Marinitoga sp. 1155]|uniref:peptidylprolyl isomerase n=1 Tax=Marinitoga sp. 1155 TaxID=1428448 RepID=UPI0006410CC3|nr:peptidylprolyl isomerase [Marinitoga sp. 1155]KLO22139.1 hypothetical protein X274_09175 [Marinitoga sp. 1155]
MKKNILFFLILVSAFISFGIVKYKELNAQTIAIINTENIDYNYFQSQSKTVEILRNLNNINNNFYKILVGTTEGNMVIQKYEKSVLDKLAGEILFIQFTEKVKGVNLNKDQLFNDVKNQINEIFLSSNLSENDILLYLISKGFENKEQYIYNIYHKKLYQKAISEIYKYLLSNVDVSEKEIETEYSKNKNRYYTPQSADLKLVFFKTSDDASLAYQKIIDGYYMFDDIYNKKISSNEATEIKIDIENNNNDLVNTIRTSFPGAILKPMKYNENYFSLIKIEKKYPKKQMTLEEAKQKIIENIKDEKAKQLFNKLITTEFEKFKNNSEIIINSKFFKGDEKSGN